jgi:hypothetical protein
MPRMPAVVLSLLLAAALHVDWHVARPAHHRLSLDWPYHWIATALVFGAVAWLIARKWPRSMWQLGAVVFVGAVLIAQGIEPMLEAAIYDHRFGYEGEPERWRVFFKTLAAATPVYWTALWLARRGEG